MSKIKELSNKYTKTLRRNWETAIKDMSSFEMLYIVGVFGIVTLIMTILKLIGVYPDLTITMILSPILVLLGISVTVLIIPFIAVIWILLVALVASTYREIWLPLFFIMFILKILDLITLSWLVVTSPLWFIPGSILLAILMLASIIVIPMIFIGASLVIKSCFDTLFNRK